ncbi:hypothetical protein ACSVDE_02685 [Pseudalkalibacillus sp. Hm43]|uniref:hypothetical protein n=1 Tax=Pseudalkalibacillus sp. Hm43 TaxID=3450742 RepID=UPI003F43D375
MYRILFLACILLLFVTVEGQTSTREQLSPEEIFEKADVIVLGKLQLDKEPVSNFVFRGYPFEVEKVIKGEDIPKVITAGIEMYDVPSMENFQKNEGRFLLFLEENELTGFLTSVGGSQGMVSVKHSVILSPEYIQFNGLLHKDLVQNRVFPAIFWLILLGGAVVGVIVMRKRKKSL